MHAFLFCVLHLSLLFIGLKGFFRKSDIVVLLLLCFDNECMLHKCRAGGWCCVRERAWCNRRVLCTQNVGVWRYFLKITAIHVVRAAALQHIAAEFIRNKGRARALARIIAATHGAKRAKQVPL